MNTTRKFCVPLTVYYDKSCPMCATEMHVIESLDWRGRLKLVDCSAPDFEDGEAEREGYTRRAMMTRLHARDPEGRWLTGLDAFEAVYASAGLERMASFWGNRRLRPLLGKIYPYVARHRQGLSRLGLHRLVGAVLARAGRGTR
jgi:predicted DCC family thiol-disulfide oxidoreductase YuxK